MEAIATKIEIRRFHLLNLIDTPGLSGPFQYRTDEDIFNIICDTFLEEAFKLKEGDMPSGLSGCI